MLLGGAGALIVVTAGGAFVDYSNSLDFCTSCHEMRAFVFEECKDSPHYGNASGVRPICADCHVPKSFLPKMRRKIQATLNEVPKHFAGMIDTREKFEARRPILAGHVWDEMKANDSAACRNCHDRDAMLLAEQRPRARVRHEDALQTGENCIDCHKGIAHQLPELPEDETDMETTDEEVL